MAENPFLSANAEVEAASRLSRLAARFLDGLLLFAPLPLLFMGVPAMLLGFAVLLIGQIWLLVSRGQTLGKKALDIYIMRSDGGLPHVGWLLLREFAIPAAVGLLRYAGRHDPSPIGQAFQVLLGFVGLIDILFIFSPTRRCLHDLVAGTHVVKLG